MNKSLFAIIFLAAIALISAVAPAQDDRARWEPEPALVATPEGGAPPADAIVLFDGTNLDQWMRLEDGGPARWEIADGAATVTPETGHIRTRQAFGSLQLHLEWRPTDVIDGSSQSRGNSGVFLHSQFEVQILDSWENATYVNGQAGSVYLQYPPLVNASRPPGEWQSYDIIFTAPEFDGDELATPAFVTVFQNGVLVQNRVEIRGATHTPEPEYAARCIPYGSKGEASRRDCTGKMPLILQDHGQVVSFRNIWLREL